MFKLDNERMNEENEEAISDASGKRSENSRALASPSDLRPRVSSGSPFLRVPALFSQTKYSYHI